MLSSRPHYHSSPAHTFNSFALYSLDPVNYFRKKNGRFPSLALLITIRYNIVGRVDVDDDDGNKPNILHFYKEKEEIGRAHV